MSQKLENREIRRKMARERADACIAKLDELQCDYTLLFWLEHWDTLALVDYGRDLIRFITGDMKMTREQVCVASFFNRVLEVFHERGIQGVSSRDWFATYTKQEALRRLAVIKWRKPYYPFVFQPRTPPKGGCFVICKTWQDALGMIRETLGANKFDFDDQTIPAVNCYEHMWFGLTHLFVDWELEVSKFHQGDQTVQSLTTLAEKFPTFFFNRALDLRAIDTESLLSVVVKKKSRGEKVSYHFTTNILGISSDNLKTFSRAVAEPLKDTFAEYNKSRSFEHLAGQSDLCPGIGWDQQTTHGRHQFSTMFGCKPGEFNYPHLESKIEFGDLVDGIKTTPFNFPGVHTPRHKHAMYLLYQACYSIPKPNAITLGGSFAARAFQDASQVFLVLMCFITSCMGLEPIVTPFLVCSSKGRVLGGSPEDPPFPAPLD